MFRSKALLTVALCLSLPLSGALAQSDSIISEDMIKTETVNYSKTAVAEYSTFLREYSASATEFYPYTFPLRPEVDNASFVEYHVSRRQEVKAGDLLATFSIEVDEEALASTQLSLERTKADYEAGRAQQSEAIGDMLKEQKLLKDMYAREEMTLRIKRAQLAYEQYCYQQENAIQDLEEQLAELQEENSQTQLFSPIDGVVTDLMYKRVGERVYADEVLITLYREDGMLLRVSNSDLHFRYGMDVVVMSGTKKNPIYYKGTVVAADNQLPATRRLGHAFIELEPLEEGTRLSRLSATAPTQQLENVLVVPRKAITMEGGKNYVECLVDGNVQKRFVNLALSNSSSAWILQGLEPGETVIID